MDNTNEGVKAVKVYVTTDYKGCEYITPGKPYELRDGHYITDDDGGVMFINMNRCVHINGGNWRYTNEGMQIEEGKYYLRANGKKAGPAKGVNSPCGIKWNVPNSEGDLLGYYDDGRVCNPDLEDEYNLIAEWTEEPQTDTPKTSSPEGGAGNLLWGAMTGEDADGELRSIIDRAKEEISQVFAAYRVRPETKRDTVKLNGGCYGGEWLFNESQWEFSSHRITFDTIDGEPDCNSIKMEKVND